MDMPEPAARAVDVARLFAALAELECQRRHADPANWWATRVALLNSILQISQLVIVDPRAVNSKARSLATTQDGCAIACREYTNVLAARRDPTSGAVTPEYRLLHQSVPHVVYEQCGVFPTLAAALAAAGHPEPVDWTAMEVPDFIQIHWTHHRHTPFPPQWIIHGRGVVHDFRTMLTAGITAELQPKTGDD